MSKSALIFFIIVIVSLLGFITASDVYKTCGDSVKCLEGEFIKYIDEMDEVQEVAIIGDFLSLEKRQDVLESPARSNENLFDRATRYLASHQLKIKTSEATPRGFVQEGRRKKLRRMILPILLLLKLKAAIVIPTVLSAIALVAFKGLGAGLMALVISMATGLKSLLEHGHHHHANTLTYEILPQLPAGPHWSRNEPQGYQPIP